MVFGQGEASDYYVACVTFEGGEGPSVTSKLVGRAVPVECGAQAHAGDDQLVECEGPDGTSVTLDAGLSRGVSYLWEAPGIVFDDPTAIQPTAIFPLGTTIVTLTVSDGESSEIRPSDMTCWSTPISLRLGRRWIVGFLLLPADYRRLLGRRGLLSLSI